MQTELNIHVAKSNLAPDAVRRAALETGFRELPISAAHAVAVRQLPPHHHDPFDRLLIAQARTEPLPLMTDDPLISVYPVQRIRARGERIISLSG